MNAYEKKRIEIELRQFTARNFIRPSDCSNLDQIQFYIRELCLKIEEYEKDLNYVPESAYTLLDQYNAKQNTLLHKQFIRNY